MKPKLNILWMGLSIVLLFVLCERPAMAYTDPGSGTLIIQSLFAGLVGGLFYARRLVKWVRKLLWDR